MARMAVGFPQRPPASVFVALGLVTTLGLMARPAIAMRGSTPMPTPSKDNHVVVTFKPNVGDYFPKVVDLVLGLGSIAPMRMKDTYRFTIGSRGTRNDYAVLFASLPYVAQVSPAPDLREMANPPVHNYVEGELLVKFKPSVTQAQIDAFNAKYGVTIKDHISGIEVWQLQWAPGRSVEEMQKIYTDSGLVEYAEPNHKVSVPILPNMRPHLPSYPSEPGTGSVHVHFSPGAIPELVALVYGMRPLGSGPDATETLAPSPKATAKTAARILRLCPQVESATVSS